MRRRLIALAGPPGAGKSTLAPLIAARIGGAVVPMDGFHLDNAILDAEGWRPRKGSPWTFDRAGLLHALRRLQTEDEVILPAFDRARDAAIAGAIRVRDEAVLVVEGNYLLAWPEVASLFDASVLLEVPQAELTRRLLHRWRDLSAEDRAVRMDNDLENAAFVMEGSRADHRIPDDGPPELIADRIAALIG